MKHKKIKIAALAIVTASLLGGILYSEFGTKKSYDYSEYYVESKPSKTAKDNKDDKGASEKELSLSLLQKTNKDVVGILEFDNRVIYEPVVQAPDNDYYVRKTSRKNMPMQVSLLYQQMEILILKMLSSMGILVNGIVSFLLH